MFLFLFMRIIKIKKLYNAPSMQLLMELSLVSAMGCVGLVDVAVSRFESPVNTGFVDDTGTAVVRQHTEEQRIIRSEIVIEGDEPAEIPAEKGIRLSLGELDTSSERLSRLHHMSVSDRRPVAWAVERLELLYNQHGAFKRRQVHYAFSRVGGGRGCRQRGDHPAEKKNPRGRRALLPKGSATPRRTLPASSSHHRDYGIDHRSEDVRTVVVLLVIVVELECAFPRGRTEIVLHNDEVSMLP